MSRSRGSFKITGGTISTVGLRRREPGAAPNRRGRAVLILVSYDIPDDRRRTRLAHALKDFGERVQYSVFECRLKEEQLNRLRTRVAALIEAAEDSVRIYRLCAECAARLEIQGLGPSTEDPNVYVL